MIPHNNFDAMKDQWEPVMVSKEEQRIMDIAVTLAMSRGWLQDPRDFVHMSVAIKGDFRKQALAVMVDVRGMIEEEVALEREASAQIAENMDTHMYTSRYIAQEQNAKIAEAIRDRG